jgi:hypothetical protein
MAGCAALQGLPSDAARSDRAMRLWCAEQTQHHGLHQELREHSVSARAHARRMPARGWRWRDVDAGGWHDEPFRKQWQLEDGVVGGDDGR